MRNLFQILASLRALVDAASSPRLMRTVTAFQTRRDAASTSTGFSAVSTALLAILSFAAFPAFAAEQEITFRGQKVYVEGDPIIVAGDERDPAVDGELVLVYTNSDAAAVNTLRTTAKVEFRALLVGGGGAGGYGTTATTNPGGGGGGGEVKELSNAEYAAGTFAAIVGLGGAQTTTQKNGENGHPSSISLSGAAIASALGGGGGGAKAAGSGGDTVATGGGGGGNGNLGGVGALGENHKGGKAINAGRSGGGGGAGGPGDDSTSAKGGDGGAGASSDIWLDDDKNPRVFGGGGGGAQSTDTTTSKIGLGKDGGGDGGRQNNAPGAGTPNTGGGGGGGGRSTATHASHALYGAAGGSGIVIIRLTYIEVPMVWKEILVSAGGNSGKIFVDENAVWTRVDPSDLSSDLIISFTNVTVRGGLRFFDPDDPSLPPIWATARVLAVGGGGGGGLLTTRNAGGGGGGGAGGFVEKQGLVFDNVNMYSITVGKGGTGADTNLTKGKIGGDSSVVAGGVNVVDIAKGGGGGGAESAGADGGSGGGGSQCSTRDPVTMDWRREGGVGTSGQGFAGGAGIDSYRGGGGGGAGGVGQDGSNANGAGAGGIGKACDISGVEKWYAGGGGGAFMNPTSAANKYLGGAGGQGGGGKGAGNADTTTVLNPVAAEDGAANTGGGGGGGTSHAGGTTPAGSGGSGIVIIRLSGFVVKNIPLPKTTDFIYDGNAHTGVVEFFAYTLTGTPVATNSDWYAVTATISASLPSDIKWKTGDRDPKTVWWCIKQMQVPNPFTDATPSFVYNGLVRNPVDVTKFPIDADGQVRVNAQGEVVASGGMPYCTLFEYEKTDAGEYTAVAKLVTEDPQGNFATNFVWANTWSMDDRQYPWSITQAPNAITGFYYDGYRTPDRIAVHHPTNQFTASFGQGTTKTAYRVDNGDGTYGEWIDWDSTVGPQESGNYEVRVAIDETKNWQGVTNTLPFGAWKKLSELYSDRMEVTASGNTSGTTELKNFPIPVKVHEPAKDGFEAFSGFTYLRAGADGTAIHFFDQYGDPIPHDVDTWNTRGESIVWVKVPSLKGSGTSGTKLTMCWRRLGNIRLPAYDGGAVWRDNYAGVWHLGKPDASGRYADATGHGLHAYTIGGSTAENLDAKLGKGLYLKQGELRIDNYEPYLEKPGAPFAYSAWYLGKDYKTGGTKGQPAQNLYMFAGKKTDGQTTNPEQFATGWCLTINNNVTYYLPYSSGNNNFGNKTIPDIPSNWAYLGFKAPVVGTSTTLYCEYNSNATTFNDVSAASKTVSTNALAMQIVRQGFAVDEARLAKSSAARETAWMKNEFETLRNASFCTYAPVQIDCDQYNDGAGLICDWWNPPPEMAKTVWKTNETVTLSKNGRYQSAAAVTVLYTNMLGGAASTVAPKTNGYYRVISDHGTPTPYRPQAYAIDFYIIEGVDPSHDLGEGGGASGRILLMNSDNNASYAVTNQGWCATDPAGVTYWKTLNTGAGTNNVMPGTSFELLRGRDGARLWYLRDCRQGNTFPTNNTAALASTAVYLPQSSSTALAITNETITAARGDTGWLMMRNVACGTEEPDASGAAVYSPCYTNGIGTIYFDAVNSQPIATNWFELVLEVATETKYGLPPVDTNCWQEIKTPEGQVTGTNFYGNLDGMWRRVDLCASRYRNTGFTEDLTPTNRLSFRETQGGRQTYFYRVHAPVNEHRPVRFRLRRVSEGTNASVGSEEAYKDANYILLDNLIVSKPPVYATLEPYGSFDQTLPGNAAVGQGGAFVPAFPAAADLPLRGRCKVTLPPGSGYETENPDKYLSLAQLFYRWRYLGQCQDWAALVLKGDGAGRLASEGTMETPRQPGDIEFYFVSIMKSPYYGYTDYTGLTAGQVSKAGYSEETLKKESHYENRTGMRLASLGSEWFARVRDGRCDYERMQVELSGVAGLSGEYAMRLTEDNVWRVAVKIPTNVTGTCKFQFRGLNKQTSGSTEYAVNETRWGGAAGQSATLPGSGALVENGEGIAFAVDHVTSYVEFKIRCDGSPTWSASRAEYQNFNNWHDVWSSPLAEVFTVATNGVDDVGMTTTSADMSTWALYESENALWNETFSLGNYNDPGYPKETFYTSHKTPNEWLCESVTFVSRYLAAYKKPTEVDKGSGMAAKLLGQGSGRFMFSKSSGPAGIERVDLSARLGQTLSYERFCYAPYDMYDPPKNYLFLAPASMSRAVPANDKDGDMSVGGAVSIIAYYQPWVGCYEFRVTRAASGAEVVMELWKWSVSGWTLRSERLCGQRYNFTGNDELRLWNDSGEYNPLLYGFFISVKTSADGKFTEIYAGVGKNAAAPTARFSSGVDASFGYGGLYVKDTVSPLTQGTYGLAAKDCPAQFIYPRHYTAPLASTVGGLANTTDRATYPVPTGVTAQYFRASSNPSLILGVEEKLVDDRPAIDAGRWVLTGNLEKFVNETSPATKEAYHGLRTPVGQTQRLKVQLQPRTGGGDWQDAGSVTVGGYAFESFSVPLYRSGDWNLRLVTDESKAVEVVVGEVRQRQWQGVDYEKISSERGGSFVYTQGCVLSNVNHRAHETVLQPARGTTTKAISVRSPILNGLGKVSFTYSDVDPNAELWVQVATNNVLYNLTGANGYNFSVKSIEPGRQEQVGEWITVAKYGPTDECPDGPLDASGVKTVYLGWHDQAGAPVQGLFRVFVPPAVVSKALVAATNATKNASYGKVTVTGMTVSDEPGVTDRSWRGWNLRTVGDAADTEGRMSLADGTLADDLGYGLVCGLNNSINDLKAGSDPVRAASQCPSVMSPTFVANDGSGVKRSIGSVTFRARLYYADGVRETDEGGKVSVWGTTDAAASSPTWTKVKEFAVVSSVFSNFTWSANGVNFTAVKLEISDPSTGTTVPKLDRLLLDEITVCEKVQPSISFLYARPFRTDLFEPVEIKDILSMNQQPLVGESWGVQTKLVVSQSEGDISDLEVYFTYKVGKSPWGYGKWKSGGTTPVRLEPIGEATNYVFRSVGTNPDGIVLPVSEPNTVVQYMLIARFRQETPEGEIETTEQPIESWTQPAWYAPIDYNKENGGDRDPAKFSPYTILDTVSPGRAWINEVNWNDGPYTETHTKTAVVSNQFIEICVPSGVDMTGWYLRLTDLNLRQWTMAMFGQQVPARKVSPQAVNGFEFVVLESPETNYRGGIRDPEGNPAADGTWASDGPNGTAKNGTLNYSYPYQFELIRPSGIVEHQFVLQGTNEWAVYGEADCYGTNLLARLNAKDYSAKRFYAAEETSTQRDGAWLGSAGVVGGEDDGDPAPGAEGTWTNGLKFTAGRLNEGQVIPKNWYLAPNGTNSWVYLYLDGSHLSQSMGGETNRAMMVVVTQGVRTNVTYTAEPWYETATVTVKTDDGEREVPFHRRGAADFFFTPTGVVTLTAHEGVDSGLARFNIGFGEGCSAYSRAVVNWLHDEYPDATPDDIRLARYMNLNYTAAVTNLTLTEMYWFDIPPVNSEGNASTNSEWWLRGGFTGIRPQEYLRKSFNGVVNTNNQFDVKLYLSNDFTQVVHAPRRLQGLANEKSDEYAGAWTSVTFKISGKLLNGEEKNKGYLPFRMFTFGSGSFTDAAGDATLDPPLGPFSSRIEILDPFSTGSPGYSYGWSKYPNTTPFWFKWSVDTLAAPDTVQVLKKEDVYEDVP